jgi:UDP-N-acetylglucosamine--N-acetylmuramyl-(pentapeptide) pyrophosphoryl-undecaprenol N-acetylglucosamine transferase
MTNRTVVVAAGGTGGHMFPAAAFCAAMRNRGWHTVLMTDARGRTYATNFPADVIEDVPAATIRGFNPLRAVIGAVRIAAGVDAARERLAAHAPALVAGFGGYPSFPALAAARGRIPILIHEQNAVLGRVNRLFAGSAAAVATGFSRIGKLPAKASDRHAVVGNPVRAPILALREHPYPAIGAHGTVNILVIGGSQGASLFGQVIPPAIASLSPESRARVRVTQQVRAEQLAEVGAFYTAAGISADLAPFFDDMAARLAETHLVIARAGASSVSELAIVGRPSILVPLAIAADDHQTQNALGLAEVGATDVLPEAQFTPDALTALLEERLADPHGLLVRAMAARSAGRPDATSDLCDLAERVALPVDL